MNSPAPNSSRCLPCRVGPVRLAFDVARLGGIRRADGVQRNPSSEGPAGWLLDDREIPVLDLAPWLGVDRGATFVDPSQRRVLVFEGDDGPRAVLVDESGSAREVQPGHLHPLPRILGSLEPLGLRSLWVSGDYPWFVIDPATLSPDLRHPRAGEASPGPQKPQNRPPMPTPPARIENQGRRLLLFSTPQGEIFERPVRFGLSITQVLEVTSLPALEAVPRAPDYVRGLALWQDAPLVVVDVDRRMGWASSEHSGDRLLVVQAMDGTRLGLVASATQRLLSLPVPHRPGDLSFSNALVLAVFELEEETLIIPDLREFASLGVP